MIVRVAVAAFLASAVGIAISAAPRDQAPPPRVASLNSIPTGMSATPATVRRVEVQPSSPSAAPIQEKKASQALPAPQLLAPEAPQPATPLSIEPGPVVKPVSNSIIRAGWQPGAAGCTSYKTYNAQTQTYRATDGQVRQCHAPAG